jgi:hypothetical protein
MSGADLLQAHLTELCEQVGAQGELHPADGRLYVVLKQLALPAGLFNLDRSDVLFISDFQYPLSAMDMFWVQPELTRPDGAIPAGAESIEPYLGRNWRRFSWHRQGVWRPTGNPLLDHYALTEARWAEEPRQEQAA